MKPYSNDLRLRVLAGVDRAVPREEVAKTFSVSVPTIKRLSQEASRNRRRRAKADPQASPSQGSGAPRVVALPPARQQRPHSRGASRGFRRAHRLSGLGLHGEPSHRGPARRTLADQKKAKVASEREEEARGLWRWLASHFDARRLVFVDESGMHTSMTRLYARAPRGQRAYGKVPRNRGKNTTLIASITLEGAMGESMTVEGATDALRSEEHTSELQSRQYL